MAFDVSALTAYVEENKSELVMKPITGTRTFDFVDLRENIRPGDKIPILDSTAPAQAGSGCGFTSSGTTTFSQRELTTTTITIQEELCLNTLETYFTQKYLGKGANHDTADFAADVINRKLARIAQKTESMIWQGKTTYGNDTYLKQMNGWLAQIDAGTNGTAISATAQTSVTTSTIRGIIEEIAFQKIPAAIRTKKPAIFCGMNDFYLAQQKYMVDNMYHVPPSSADFDGLSMRIPGTNVMLIAVPGLNNDNPVDSGTLPTAVKNRFVAGSLDNFIVGFDAKTDMQEFDVWYSKDNRTLRFHLRYRIGVTNLFGDQIVQYTNS